jgi:hypothetical protein
LQGYVDKYANEWAYQVAELHALRGEPDAMFRWLERAHAQRDPGIENLLYSPLLQPYEDDPRFAAYARKVGLPWPPAGAKPAARSTER